jgi:hypothetical protein
MHPKIFNVTFPFHVQNIPSLQKILVSLCGGGGVHVTLSNPRPNVLFTFSPTGVLSIMDSYKILNIRGEVSPPCPVTIFLGMD